MYDGKHKIQSLVHRPDTQIQGTGMGLATVKKIVMAHAGRIEVESQVNHGITFTVLLPLTVQSASETAIAR